jgi:DNA invertase Pin-like site-specific DNA recombinase
MGKAHARTQAHRAAAGYLRRSTDRQEQSLEDQRDAVESYAQSEGLRIVEWFVDDAISGTSTEARKGFQSLIRASQKPSCPFHYVLVYDVKRFGRVDTDEAGYYRHLLRRADVEVIYTSEGFNGGDSDDLLRSVKQWQARAESKDLSKVTIRGQMSVVDKGYWGGGVPPYGYDLLYEDGTGRPIRRIRFATDGSKEEYEPDGNLIRVHPRGTRLARPKSDRPRLVLGDDDRVALVRRIFMMYVEEGLGYRTIAEKLNLEGIPSPRDGHWSRTTDRAWGVGTIRSMILNGNYTGDTHWNRRSFSKFHRISGGSARERLRRRSDKPDWNPKKDWIIVKETHPAIISRETFRRVVAERQAGRLRSLRASYRSGKAKQSSYLLSGLLQCACGHSFNGQSSTKGKRLSSGQVLKTAYYICGGYLQKGRAKCVRFRIPHEELQKLIWEMVQRRLQYVCSGGAGLVTRMIRRQWGAGRPDPVKEKQHLHATIEEINRRASTLVDGLSATAAELVKEKLEALGYDRRLLEIKLAELEARLPSIGIDPNTVVSEMQTYLGHLSRVRESASLDQQKRFLRGLISSIEVNPRNGRATVTWRLVPVPWVE